MTAHPKIYLVHALRVSMPPVEAQFKTDWPQARQAHLLEDSLYADFLRDGVLTPDMIGRFRALGHYCVSAGADAILFTGSAFGPAVEAVSREQRIPVLKPNEALYDEMIAHGGRIALLATFAPTLPAMMAELDVCAAAAGVSVDVTPYLVQGALDALLGGRPDVHDRLIIEAAERHAQFDAVAFGQISMMPALLRARTLMPVPVLGTADSAIRKLRTLLA